MSRRARGCLAAAVCALAACTFDEGANAAHGCDELCAPDACYLGYCLLRLDAPPAAGAPIAGTSSPGVSTTAGAGAPIAGTASGASGQGPSGAGADPGSAGQSGSGPDLPAAGAGGMPACALSTPAAESCNGLDDDCNGLVDDGADEVCYPAELDGCELRAEGDAICSGLCTAGTRTCAEGTLSPCEGFVGPEAEECGGEQAADESCDGAIDDGCPCSGDETQRCYGGPLFTAGIGLCRSGMQRCVNGAFGACEGAVTPMPESCQNPGADDDCNFVRDDVPGAGLPCVRLGQLGECRYGVRECRDGALTCVAPTALSSETACDLRDEDCDGAVDEDYDLPSDEANCGACGVACGGALACCDGACVATNTVQHCGGCSGCGSGQACCGGTCVAANTVQRCGGCSPCAAGQACCGGACVATNTVLHCGGCGGCADGQACCDGRCVDTNTGAHCGGCNPCTEGQACCGGSCVSIDTDAHCGSCRGCGTGEACCDRACVPTDTPLHCGGCGGCQAGEQCCDRTCVDPGVTDGGLGCP